MKEKQSIASEEDGATPVLPKCTASKPFLIPWESNKDNALMMSVTYLKGYFSEQGSLKNVKFSLNIAQSVFDNHFEFDAHISNTENYIVSIDLTLSLMKVCCSCGEIKTGLCQHAYTLIRDRLRNNRFYFKHLYNEQWNYPNQEQRNLFKVYVANVCSRSPKVILHAADGLGRIYRYPNDKENIDSRFYFEEQTPLEKEKRLVFAIPINNDIYGLPILMPFLSRDRRGNTFQSSYLFNEDLPQPKTLNSYELALDAVARQMLKISGFSSSDPLSQDEMWHKKQKLMNLWRDVISNYLKNDDTLFFESYRKNYDIAEIILRNSSTNRYQKLKVAGDDFKINIQLIESQEGILVEVLLYYKGAKVKTPKFMCTQHSFLMEIGSKSLLFVDDFHVEQVLNKFRHSDFKIFVLKQDFQRFYEDIIKPLLGRFPVQFGSYRPESDYKSHSDIEVSKLLDLNTRGEFLHLEAKMVFGDVVLPILDSENPEVLCYSDNKVIVVERNYDQERGFASFVENQHELFCGQPENDSWKISLADIARSNWIEKLKKSCRENQIQLRLNGIQRGLKYYPYEPNWEVLDVHSRENVLYIRLRFKLGSLILEPTDFERYLFDKNNWYLLNNSEHLYISDSLRSKFTPLFSQGKIEGEYLVLTSAQSLSFQTVLEKIDPKIVNDGLRSRREKLENMEEIPLISVPANMTVTLRPYQLTGLSWMTFLQEFQWGGILADDMGLGKTLQVITLLEYYYQRNPRAAPSIVIVPNSLLFNWKNEYRKFAPEREVVIYHGAKRKDITELNGGAVMLTTYGTVMSDALFLKETVFSYMILDESQAIKNRNSKTFQYLLELKCHYRIAMTGTPVENGIEDIFAQMTMVNPGFFGSYRNFNRMFRSKVSGEKDDKLIQDLQKMIQPFMLRRTKKQVALDLPDKTETTLLVDMLPEQRKIYDRYRKIYQGEVAENLNSADSSKSKFVAMEALSKLRQICNSPALLKDEKLRADSVKLDHVDEILSEVIPGHKILLFSFFTSMLQLVEERIKAQKVGYAYLDGKLSQQQRQAAVERFQSDESCRVFLISLKAGGTGLNLTAADYVYILDPWWNPAVEAQAIDRCYRIGQEKRVNAYKIVCRDSVEEKILALQEQKKQLADGLILDETNLMKTLSKGELLKLFE